MNRLIIIVCCLLISPIVSAVGHAEEKKADTKPWLGLYFGSQIPGYVVVKSSPVRISAWQAVDGMIKSEASDPLIGYLTVDCKKVPGGGVAVVNIKSIVALGTIPGPSASPNTNITNGMFKEYEGDCVTEVERLKK